MLDFLQSPLTIVSLIALVILTSQFVKDSTKVDGGAMRWLSFGIGFGLAAAYQVAQLYPPAAPIVSAGFFCLFVGAGAPGGFSLLKELTGQRNDSPAH